MLRPFFICLAALSLVGCSARHYRDSTVNLQTFEKGQQALVVLSLKTTPNLLGIQKQVLADLIKVDSHGIINPHILYQTKTNLFELVTNASDDFNVMMIEPGFYIIDNLSWQDGNARYTYDASQLQPTTRVGFGAFYVKPGAVAYVGHFEVKRTSSLFSKPTFTIKRVNAFDEAKLFLRGKHPKLASQLTQVDYYPAGTPFVELDAHAKITPAPLEMDPVMP